MNYLAPLDDNAATYMTLQWVVTSCQILAFLLMVQRSGQRDLVTRPAAVWQLFPKTLTQVSVMSLGVFLCFSWSPDNFPTKPTIVKLPPQWAFVATIRPILHAFSTTATIKAIVSLHRGPLYTYGMNDI